MSFLIKFSVLFTFVCCSLANEFAILEDAQLKTNQIYGSIQELNSIDGNFTPIVLWHGMGDTGYGVKSALKFIERELPGVYIKSLQIGENIAKDMENSYFMNVNDQIKLACEMIKVDEKLQNGFNAIGLSQGGQFLRGLAQRCPSPRMKNLISFGGQHQGIFGLPKCQAPKHEWCEIVDKLLTHVAYAQWVQKFLVQAEYWHDPFKTEEYLKESLFIADINNERNPKNQQYKENLVKLENLILVLFENETIVQPKESEWFGFFEDGQDKIMISMKDTNLYKEDWIGLKTLDESGRLHLLSTEGDHLQFTDKWFNENILPFLNKQTKS